MNHLINAEMQLKLAYNAFGIICEKFNFSLKTRQIDFRFVKRQTCNTPALQIVYLRIVRRILANRRV